MNRIVLIGNGFDLAHGLKTSYQDFINWYWSDVGRRLMRGETKTVSDGMCSFVLKDNINLSCWAYVWGYHYVRNNPFKPWNAIEVVKLAMDDKELCKYTISPFLSKICISIETKGWVDIENEYYSLLNEYTLQDYSKQKLTNLNNQLNFLKEKLIEYLELINQQKVSEIRRIHDLIYTPIKLDDISVGSKSILKECVDSWVEQNDIVVMDKIHRYGLNVDDYNETITYFKENYKVGKIPFTDIPRPYMLPDAVMLLNFNYTNTAQLYYNSDLGFINHIHGKIENPESVIFGYGDELDDNYKKLQKLNENECLCNIKTIKYQESDNYRRLLAFAESEPYQIYIMGHSCGNSDRTLLNTLFEHKNCVSIKPYYYIKDDGTNNYIELIQNISRNFTDMKLMRDRVVNKTYCEPLTNKNNN